uniref:Uncharacterized protein n=1 Tax=Candidatus Kentrum sp. TC TaxID=2126339 RepID=A0A450Z4N7_9GAMM|nr:MAG: hypothetical protein BECKTC1821E_GA0114239_11227 [Candidatus Kentron sp. TC]
MEDMLALRAKTEREQVLAYAPILPGFLFFRYLNTRHVFGSVGFIRGSPARTSMDEPYPHYLPTADRIRGNGHE